MKRILSFLVLTFLLSLLVCSSAFAATGYQGMPLYRDGAAGGLYWHAGLFYEDNAQKSLPIVHIGGYGKTVKKVNYDIGNDNFLGEGNNFMGV